MPGLVGCVRRICRVESKEVFVGYNDDDDDGTRDVDTVLRVVERPGFGSAAENLAQLLTL